MRPALRHPPVDLSAPEQGIVKRIRRAKLFVFLWRQRQAIVTDAFQTELAQVYKDSPLGQPPMSPAQLALVPILQAYTGVSDDEVIEATLVDRRWQLVLDCLDCTEPPFSNRTLVACRRRMIARNWDRRLIERTVEIAEQTKESGSRPLRAALDSSPLWGGGDDDGGRPRGPGHRRLGRGPRRPEGRPRRDPPRTCLLDVPPSPRAGPEPGDLLPGRSATTAASPRRRSPSIRTSRRCAAPTTW